MEGGGRLGRPEEEPPPSEHTSRDGWLWLTDYHPPPPAALPHRDGQLTGKFMVFGGDERRNKLWRLIVEGVRDGKLPGVCQAKAHAGSARSGVICVYSPDFTDVPEVAALGAALVELLELDPSKALPYKTNNQTRLDQDAPNQGDRPHSYYQFKEGVLWDSSDKNSKRRVWPPPGAPPLLPKPAAAAGAHEAHASEAAQAQPAPPTAAELREKAAAAAQQRQAQNQAGEPHLDGGRPQGVGAGKTRPQEVIELLSSSDDEAEAPPPNLQQQQEQQRGSGEAAAPSGAGEGGGRGGRAGGDSSSSGSGGGDGGEPPTKRLRTDNGRSRGDRGETRTEPACALPLSPPPPMPPPPTSQPPPSGERSGGRKVLSLRALAEQQFKE
ncbi:hypothetical protein Rsub_12226 [Raphidocelis subcapitata]|uniref:Uncharacterized protein n=1 Tax=Raphidocelis subcapitata TaxID=307507 RepID=A0A2V0PJ93_9CHLO|nr:hypothetical protein Rsub_12226 [Raphidocelis subcapitata]|eukprot:GBF99786.1 hypothetical protein Rsub_12226 [Raphidocelis subcapitata]